MFVADILSWGPKNCAQFTMGSRMKQWDAFFIVGLIGAEQSSSPDLSHPSHRADPTRPEPNAVALLHYVDALLRRSDPIQCY